MSDKEEVKEGFFQINDVKLAIPPSQIQVSKMNHANKIANLRTSSEATIWSRNKETHVNVKLFFTDNPKRDGTSGFTDLIKIVAGLRVTPFCYIENKFIRDSIIGAGKHKTMMFAMRSMSITTSSNAQSNSYMPGTVSVEMDLSYFNYNSYVSDFKYRLAPFNAEVKDDPSESASWIMMRLAEQRKRSYLDIASFTHKTKPVYPTIFEFSEFKMTSLASFVEQIEKRKTDYEENFSMVEELELSQAEAEANNWVMANPPEEVNTSHSGSTSMISPETAEKEKTIEEILMTEDINSFSMDGGWKLYKMRDGSLYDIKKNPFKSARSIKDIKGVKQDDLFLVTRLLHLSLGNSGLHILGININFTNRVTPISLLGSEAPTFQYLGGSDALVSMSLKTTSTEALRAVVSLERLWQSQSSRMRVLPLKIRRIRIVNDILNMCGLNHFLLNNINISTSPGEPNCRYVHLDLSEKEFDGTDEAFTYERFSLYPDDKILKLLIPTFDRNLDFLKDQYSTGFLTNRIDYKKHSDRIHGKGYITRREVATESGRKVQIDSHLAAKKLKSRKLVLGDIGEEEAYIRKHFPDAQFNAYNRLYVPKTKDTKNISKHVYVNFLNSYSFILSELVEGLVDYLQVTNLASTFLPFPEARVISHKNNLDAQEFFSDYYDILRDRTDLNISVYAVDWEAKRWRFINELKESEFLSIGKARKDAFSILMSVEKNQKGGSYYKDLLNGKIDKKFLSNDGALDIEYDAEVMWKDLKSQEFFVKFVSKRNRFFKEIVKNEAYLKIIGEIEPELKTLMDDMAKNYTNSGSNAYPDFPMEEVVDQLGEGYEDLLNELQSQIVEVNKNLHGGFLSIPRLFGPDFYVANPVEQLDTIIGKSKLKTAAALVSKTAASKPGKLNDWLSTLYKNKIGKEAWDESITNRTEKGKEDIKRALENGLVPKESVEKYYTDPKYQYFLPSDFDGEQVCGSVKHDVKHIYAKGDDQIDSQVVLSYPSDAQGILKMEGGVGLKKKEKEAYGVPDFRWPTNSKRVTSPFGPRKGYSGKDHNGVDIGLERGKNNSFPDNSIRASASGTIIWMEPKSDWEKKIFPQTLVMQDFPMQLTLTDGKFTWKDHFQKKTKLNLDKIEDIEKFKKEKGYGNRLWNALKNKKYTPTHMIIIKHEGGWRTYYKHIANDSFWKNLYKQWKATGGLGLDILQGTKIGNIGDTGFSTAAHLHFSLKHKGNYEDPEKVILKKEFTKTYKPKHDFTKGVPVLENSYNQFEKSMEESRGMIRAYPTFKLYFIESDAENRSLFGFDDHFSYQAVQEIQVVRNADNPVDLCIIRLTNLTGNLTNRKFTDLKQRVGGPDSSGNRDDPVISSPVNGQRKSEEDIRNTIAGNVDNELENPITSLLLKSGTQIQLRMGYDPNPDSLPIVFNGVVMDIQYHGSDEMITITCQSYGMELASNLQGVKHGEEEGKKKKTEWEAGKESRTGKIVETLMSYPELKHFGRWQKTNATGFSQIVNKGDGVKSEDIENLSLGGMAKDSVSEKDWELLKEIYDDNIFLPERGMAGVTEGTPFVIYKSTIWDVIQELSYRHPGLVAYPVPYQGSWGPRMTLFFGLPDGNYVSRDPTSTEEKAAESLRSLLVGETATGQQADKARDFILKVTDGSLDPNSPSGLKEASKINLKEDSDLLARDYMIGKTLYKFSATQGIIKSFRNYHLLTDGHNIIENSIISSTYSTFNSATIEYSEGTFLLGEGASIDRDEEKLDFGASKTYTLKADAGIRDEELREVYAGFPNCFGIEQAKRYGQSLLWRSMKQGYRGSVVILGDPNIKPYDICYVFDSFTETYGPIEVEQVVHRFSHQSGFITEIVPRMCISTNEEASESARDVLALVAEDAGYSEGMKKWVDPDYEDSFLGNSLEHAQKLTPSALAGGAGYGLLQGTAALAYGGMIGAGLAVAGTVGSVLLIGAAVIGGLAYMFADDILLDASEEGTGPLDAIGIFTFRKMITRTQMQHLFEYSPLSVRGRPLLGGLPIHKKSWGPGSFIQAYIEGAKDKYEYGREGYAYLMADEDKKNNPEFHETPPLGGWE